jgi:hypothetical protein
VVLSHLCLQLHGELTQLDRQVSEHHAAAAHRRLVREQARWDHALRSAAAAAAAGGELAVLQQGVAVMWEVLGCLPDFRRKTLMAQHAVMFSEQMAEQAARKQQEAERRQQAAADADMSEADPGGQTAEALSTIQAAASDAAGQPGHAISLPADLQPSEEQEQRDDGGSADLAALLQAAEERQPFISSAAWAGPLPGYAFKLGGGGQGYYLDAPPEVEAFLTLGRVSCAGGHMISC